MPTAIKPTLKTVQISFFAIFLVITALGICIFYFDVSSNNAYDLVAKTSEFSTAVSELQAAYQRADICGREIIVSGKSETALEPARAAVWQRFNELFPATFSVPQTEMLENLRVALQSKFDNQDQLIKYSYPATNVPIDLRERAVIEAKNVSELFINLQLEEARAITDKSKNAEVHRRRFRYSVFCVFFMLYIFLGVTFVVTRASILARQFAADRFRAAYEKAKEEGGVVVGSELYNEVIEFLEETESESIFITK